MARIKVGCCGFPMSKEKYFKEFAVVEVQQTFYQPPKLEVVKKWRAQAPAEFEFTLKAWQLITHEPSSPTYKKAQVVIPEDKKSNYGFFKPTEEVFGAWEITKEVCEALKAKLVVFQCPASFKPTEENLANMRSFFKQIEDKNLTFVWEPRGKWEKETIIALCQELDLIHCVDPFQADSLFGTIKYFRLHGLGGYRYKYTDQDLEFLKGKCRDAETIYCMFNNVFMAEDALRFKRLLKEF